VYDIGAIDERDYYVKFHLCNKEDYFKWALHAIYGPAQILRAVLNRVGTYDKP
jgi:hypothetical protein